MSVTGQRRKYTTLVWSSHISTVQQHRWPVAAVLDNTNVACPKVLSMGLERPDKRDGRNFWTSEAVQSSSWSVWSSIRFQRTRPPMFLGILIDNRYSPLDVRCSSEDPKSDFHEDRTGKAGQNPKDRTELMSAND